MLNALIKTWNKQLNVHICHIRVQTSDKIITPFSWLWTHTWFFGSIQTTQRYIILLCSVILCKYSWIITKTFIHHLNLLSTIKVKVLKLIKRMRIAFFNSGCRSRDRKIFCLFVCLQNFSLMHSYGDVVNFNQMLEELDRFTLICKFSERTYF